MKRKNPMENTVIDELLRFIIKNELFLDFMISVNPKNLKKVQCALYERLQ